VQGEGTTCPYVACELKLILHVLGSLDVNTRPHLDSSHNLLANKVSDLNLEVTLAVLVDVDVDGETNIKLVIRRTNARRT
jgi:hypothetical protein